MVKVPLSALVYLIEAVDSDFPDNAKDLTGELRACLPKKHPGYVSWSEKESPEEYVARKTKLFASRAAAS
jgi:hypothetical protein